MWGPTLLQQRRIPRAGGGDGFLRPGSGRVGAQRPPWRGPPDCGQSLAGGGNGLQVPPPCPAAGRECVHWSRVHPPRVQVILGALGGKQKPTPLLNREKRGAGAPPPHTHTHTNKNGQDLPFCRRNPRRSQSYGASGPGRSSPKGPVGAMNVPLSPQYIRASSPACFPVRGLHQSSRTC